MNPVNINFERPQFNKEDSARNMEVVNRWISDSAEKLNMLVSILQNEETHADATGDSIGEATMNFTSSDVADGSAKEWTSVPALSSGEKHNAIIGKVSQMFKNVRYLLKVLGTTDISGIGDGTATGAISALNADLAKLYPVGSIYLSTNSTNPATFIGGTWEQIKDRFLLAAGDTYAAGSTGGEAQHTLTVDEMPSHRHLPYIDGNTSDAKYRLFMGADDWYVDTVGTSSFRVTGEYYNSYKGFEANTNSVGGSKPHNNMPPYLAVYMWRRVA